VNVNVMRAVDRFAGIPLCWLSGLKHRLFPAPVASAENIRGPILVMKFFGMGSVLLSTPLLGALRKRFPAEKIIYLTFGTNGEILNALPQPDRRLTIGTGSPLGFVLDTVRALRIIRRARPAIVFDLEFFSKFSTLLGALSGASLRVGFTLPARWRRWNLTHPVPLDHGEHVTEVFLRQLRPFAEAVTTRPSISRLVANARDRDALERKMPELPATTEWIVVNINAGQTSLERRWAPDRYIEVVRVLAMENTRRRFAFTGSPDEARYVSSVLFSAPDLRQTAVNFAGRLTLGELVALLERSSLLLTNDSGPMHIAEAVGTPVVALFGPESPSLYGPGGKAGVIYKGIPCSPCLTVYNAKQFVCPYDARCMKEITVDEVLSGVRKTLSPSGIGMA
jgi:ADP-heptose:LPS heptosyltransferase